MVKAVYLVDAVRLVLIPLPEKEPSGHKKSRPVYHKTVYWSIFARYSTKVDAIDSMLVTKRNVGARLFKICHQNMKNNIT